MSIATVITSAVSLVALFWILHIYAVRRARYLVELEFESLSDKMAEEEQAIDAVDIYQPRDTNEVSINTRADSAINSHQINQKVRIKPSLATGVGR